jgi:hypothetical protein
MLEWIKKNTGREPEHPMRDPASAAALLANLRGSDSVTALKELSGWLDSLKDAPGIDEKVRSELLGLIQEAGAAHASALLGRYLVDGADKQVLREVKWKAMFEYASSATEAVCASAERLLALSKQDASLLGATAAGATRGVRACRTLAKICLVHYRSVPASLWRLAYSVHAGSETAGCAATAVHAHPGEKAVTTVTRELLRLLMLQAGEPDMLPPEQIEIADRVTERVGSDFALRPLGVTDSAFWFNPDADLPPQRAIAQQPAPGAPVRYFGPGTGFEALARLYKQLASINFAEVKVFGTDFPPHVQIAAIEHLLLFWRPQPPYSPPAHSPVTGELWIVHGHAQICSHLGSTTKGAGSLGIAGGEEAAQVEPPEVWTIRDAGGNEVGAEIPPSSGRWARSGKLVGVTARGRSEWWVGVIRRMHAELRASMRVDIALLSRKPLALSLRPVAEGDGSGVDWEASTGSFAYDYMNAVLLEDVSEASGKPTVLLPLEGWKAGQVYEAMIGESPRHLRLLQRLKRGEDYVRVACEWMTAPGANKQS